MNLKMILDLKDLKITIDLKQYLLKVNLEDNNRINKVRDSPRKVTKMKSIIMSQPSNNKISGLLGLRLDMKKQEAKQVEL